MALWAKWGSGLECICDMKAYEKPANSSLAALEGREQNLRAQGIKLAWHDKLGVELHGICLLKQGKAGFAIDGIRICRNIGVSEHRTEY